jgi:preprotein translocase subunit Sec63
MNPYQILDVSLHSSLTQIKSAYRRSAAINHPDRGGSHEAMVMINAAYEQLARRFAANNHDLDQPSHRTPTSLSDWIIVYNQLLSVVARRGYKRGWIWQLHGQVMGYKAGFARYHWEQQ